MASLKKQWLPFARFVELVREAGITSCADYKSRYKELSDKLPSAPDQQYREWRGWGSVLPESKRKKRERSEYLSYEEARKIVKEHGIKTVKEYYAKRQELSDKLPYNPDRFYRKEFISWAIFIGKGRTKEERIRKEYSFTIEGVPVMWKRAGYRARTGTFYDSGKEYKKKIWSRIEAHNKENHEDPELFYSAVKVDLLFFMPLPLAKRGRYGRAIIPLPTQPPDIDNLTKMVLDIFTKHIIYDDKQVIAISAAKKYSDHPRTEVKYQRVYEDEECDGKTCPKCQACSNA